MLPSDDQTEDGYSLTTGRHHRLRPCTASRQTTYRYRDASSPLAQHMGVIAKFMQQVIMSRTIDSA
eukprot:6164950-Pyramimonas_sp.AAC.1